MNKRPTPTLHQIISTDYLAQNFFVMIFAGWAFYLIDPLFSGKTSTFRSWRRHRRRGQRLERKKVYKLFQTAT